MDLVRNAVAREYQVRIPEKYVVICVHRSLEAHTKASNSCTSQDTLDKNQAEGIKVGYLIRYM